MAKMSSTARTAILNAYILRPARQPAYRDLGVFTRKQWRSNEAALRNGWVDRHGRETTAGLVEAGVDMAAIEDWAYREHAKRSPAHVRNNCPALPVGGCMQCTAPATVRAAQGDDSAYRPTLEEAEQWAGEALL